MLCSSPSGGNKYKCKKMYERVGFSSSLKKVSGNYFFVIKFVLCIFSVRSIYRLFGEKDINLFW